MTQKNIIPNIGVRER